MDDELVQELIEAEAIDRWDDELNEDREELEALING